MSTETESLARERACEAIDLYNELRDQACRAAKRNNGELMGDDAWLRFAMSEWDMTLEHTADGVRCWGSAYTSQTWDHERFDFIIPWDRFTL